jgi:putative ABC transport system ATP-binding protein
MLPIEQKDLKTVIKVNDLKKSFVVGTQEILVLKGFSFSISKGDFVVIFGPSGCGKSTLLHILLGLEVPTSGSIIFLDQDLYKNTDEDKRSDFRKTHLGMVYQMSNWIKSLTVQENVAFPLLLQGLDKPRALDLATDMLKKVHMENWAKFVPTELSSGQQQRVALARAMINDPEIIIADEPTGNLDYEAGQYVMGIFKEMNEKMGKTVVMVTHDLEYLTYAKTAIRMMDGNVVAVMNKEQMEEMYSDLKFKRLDIENVKAPVNSLVGGDNKVVGNTDIGEGNNKKPNTTLPSEQPKRFMRGKKMI